MKEQDCIERFFIEYLSWYKVDPKYVRFVRWSFENYLFPGIEFRGKRFLDIGGGMGTHSFYAACRGASEVVCLEPELEGSSTGMQQAFREHAKKLGIENACLLPVTFQEFESETPFDILFCHNALNHLNEEAVVKCHYDESAKRAYIELFQKMRRLCVDGGYLIIADASRHNLWATLQRRNPMMPTIEWHKHQSPRVWRRLLEQAGFRTLSIRWKSPARLGALGKIIFSHEWVNYFFWSHFCMTLRAV